MGALPGPVVWPGSLPARIAPPCELLSGPFCGAQCGRICRSIVDAPASPPMPPLIWRVFMPVASTASAALGRASATATRPPRIVLRMYRPS